MLISNLFHTQKSYAVHANKVISYSTKNEFSTLKIIKIEEEKSNVKEKGMEKILPYFIGKIPDLPNLILNVISYEQKKYVASYQASNAVKFETGKEVLPQLKFERYININREPQLASSIVVKPTVVQDKYLCFYIDEAKLLYSKAKIKNTLTHINIGVQIEVIYGKSDESNNIKKTSIKSSVLNIPTRVGNEKIHESIRSNLTSTFGLKDILSISVHVIETNPYKIQLEDVQSFTKNNEKQISNLLTKLANLLKPKAHE